MDLFITMTITFILYNYIIKIICFDYLGKQKEKKKEKELRVKTPIEIITKNIMCALNIEAFLGEIKIKDIKQVLENINDRYKDVEIVRYVEGKELDMDMYNNIMDFQFLIRNEKYKVNNYELKQTKTRLGEDTTVSFYLKRKPEE